METTSTTVSSSATLNSTHRTTQRNPVPFLERSLSRTFSSSLDNSTLEDEVTSLDSLDFVQTASSSTLSRSPSFSSINQRTSTSTIHIEFKTTVNSVSQEPQAWLSINGLDPDGTLECLLELEKKILWGKINGVRNGMQN